MNFEYRMHDPRAGRFFAVDPLFRKYPHNSPYAFSENRVIDAVELEGLEKILYFESQRNTNSGFDKMLTLINNSGVMSELQKEFASNNARVDVYLVVADLPNSAAKARTFEFMSTDRLNSKTEALPDGSGEIFKIGQLMNNSEIETVKKESPYRKVVVVVLDSDYVEKADTNLEALKSETLSIAHELKLHVMDLKDGKDDVSTKEEHDKGYDINSSGGRSPDYNAIKPNSVMGKMKSKIEDATKNKKNNEKQKSATKNFPQAKKKD